ncbi:MAG: T9SS type A sorting domain-containing protein [Bacteroidales bacterium]|nr:T9SS type A sorting domain-containing protein [Bacteroidales bacterium]MDD3892259.1 T9SS type A sorting domain-containing protein [Bacteroidales bacterium]
MKKTLLFSIALLTFVGLQGQTTLRFNTHGLIGDHTNNMNITKYTEPGVDGKNVVWDFRNLEITRDFTGTLENPNITKGAHIFNNANAALQEFNNYFFFNSNRRSIEQHGFMSASGNIFITYDEPFVKMRYPFSYGSSFNGQFSGTYNSTEKQLGTIKGTYTVEGDGIGTLILPDDKIFENALRVKEVKEYGQILNNQNYTISITTYRWYVENHRFPILVLISSNTVYENGKTHNSTQAAYNTKVMSKNTTSIDITTISSTIKLDAYPNPYKEQITFRFALEDASKINLSIFDINGRYLKTLYKGSTDAGEKEFTFSGSGIGVGAGAYIVKLNVNGTVITKKILEL